MEISKQNDNTFGKNEKLCYQKSIDRLFEQGKSFIAYPLRVVYYIEQQEDEEQQLAKLLISVPKRKFKRANKRNRIKRLIREVYRLNKQEILTFFQEKNISAEVSFIYLKDELPSYEEVDKAMKKALTTLVYKINESEE